MENEPNMHTHMYVYIYMRFCLLYIYTYVYVWVLIPGLDLSFLLQLRLMPPGLCAWKTISFAWFSFAAQFRNICLEGLGACCLRTTCCTMLGTVFFWFSPWHSLEGWKVCMFPVFWLVQDPANCGLEHPTCVVPQLMEQKIRRMVSMPHPPEYVDAHPI